MANTPEIPRAFREAFQRERYEPKRTIADKLLRRPEATPSQINVFMEAREFLEPYEETLNRWALSVLDPETIRKIVCKQTNSRKSFPVSINNNISSRVLIEATPNLNCKVIQINNGVFEFNSTGEIIRIALLAQPRTLARDTYINIEHPSKMMVFDGAENKSYRVRADGLCFYPDLKSQTNTDPERFVNALRTFTREALFPIWKA